MAETAVAVRELVAFCHRCGDIDHRFQASPTAADGQRGHREVAARRPADWEAEVALSHAWSDGTRTLLLRGRADGVDRSAALVEEIKTCRVDPARMPEALSRQHLAQGRLYAAMLAQQEELPAVTVRLTWYQLDTGEEHTLEQHYEAAELAAFLEDSLARYAAWLATVDALAAARDASITDLAFPHRDYRAGQRRAAELVYRCIDRGGQLLLEAPTGIGKTLAVLYPALKALATGKHDRLVFCTARHTGRRAAEQTLAQLEDGGLAATRLTLTAKERICFSPGKACRPEECPYARGYYDKLPAARAEGVALRRLDQPALEALARRHELCPYQLAFDLLPWCDVVIADQHYVFSLGSTLGQLAQERGERWSLLVDEAHNLPARARDMYSARLEAGLLRRARREAQGRLRRALGGAEEALVALTPARGNSAAHMDSAGSVERMESADGVITLGSPPEAVTRALEELVAAAAALLVERPDVLAAPGPLQDAWFAALAWLRVCESWGDDYRCDVLLTGPPASRPGSRRVAAPAEDLVGGTTRADPRPAAAPQRDAAPAGVDSAVLVLNCLDPGRLLGQRHGLGHASVAFSATLAPPAWMGERLGFRPDAVWHRCPSPFDPSQLAVTLEPAIDTRYAARAASREALVARLLAWGQEHPGNCLVFFPSHRYLADCRDAVAAGLVDRQLWVQPAPGDAPAEDLIALLGKARDVFALCVLGSGYSEGIDLPGDELRSVVVVGPGLPQLSHDTRALEAWFAARGRDGFACACLYPALQRVNQALGRVVRADEDRGAALLIDPRFLRAPYRGLLAPHWDYRLAGGEGAQSPAGR
jgi:DNA excision repair protein ERCC-2